MKTSLKIFLVSVSLLTIWLIVIQFQSYSYPSNEELTQRINYLERVISSDTTYNSLNNTISKSLFDRYSNTDFLNLESYPYSIWIPDNTVA